MPRAWHAAAGVSRSPRCQRRRRRGFYVDNARAAEGNGRSRSRSRASRPARPPPRHRLLRDGRRSATSPADYSPAEHATFPIALLPEHRPSMCGLLKRTGSTAQRDVAAAGQRDDDVSAERGSHDHRRRCRADDRGPTRRRRRGASAAFSIGLRSPRGATCRRLRTADGSAVAGQDHRGGGRVTIPVVPVGRRCVR